VHRRPHAHVHLTEVDEDHHQGDGVWRQMMKLETVVLQQCEKEGGHREHEPGQGVGVEENNFVGQQASEQNGSTSYPNLVLLCLPSK
jgi:hypothetical protein